ncbi:glutamate--cysteine ligase [Streptosporangium oxazolinicum]|uniref:Putative glutamate--cysteine ligase 2 n=1 Tax=Streptosporangium oxazolinicum TaxID=909287 RepID=A0ABP8ALI8_9ACTN
MTETVESAQPVPPPFNATRPLVGVEEEYLVVDPLTREVSPRAAEVIAQAARELGERTSTEITRFQVEAKTPPYAGISGLEEQVRHMRAAMAAAAGEHGLAVVASGTPVLGDVVPPLITDHPRYGVGIATYRSLHDEQTICAGHVHVHLPDREAAVLVSNHLRPWLPVLIAMMANSPMWAGRDTGYASWRTLCWGKWPVAGPPPYFSSLAEFDELVGRLTEAGVLVDPGTIFWDIRPSSRLPTLEIRVTDVPATAEEAGLLAAVVRALVVTALGRVTASDPGPRLSAELLRAAYWQAARDGLEGHGISPVTGELLATGDLLDALVRYSRPALEETGDLEMVTERLAWLRAVGTGAARQRAALAVRGRHADVVDYLVRQTTSGGVG